MNEAEIIIRFLIVATLAGLAGALAMTTVMRLMSRTRIGAGDMIVAVGGLLTRSRENARMVGVILHGISAIFFGVLYSVLLVALELDHWPAGLLAGMGMGIFHGLVVSLSLVWVVAEHHPLPEFQEASPAIFLEHFAGHVAYGTVVGLIIALAASS